jgi:hypothetical protein
MMPTTTEPPPLRALQASRLPRPQPLRQPLLLSTVALEQPWTARATNRQPQLLRPAQARSTVALGQPWMESATRQQPPQLLRPAQARSTVALGQPWTESVTHLPVRPLLRAHLLTGVVMEPLQMALATNLPARPLPLLRQPPPHPPARLQLPQFLTTAAMGQL